jgi:hypothetical protein
MIEESEIGLEELGGDLRWIESLRNYSSAPRRPGAREGNDFYFYGF